MFNSRDIQKESYENQEIEEIAKRVFLEVSVDIQEFGKIRNWIKRKWVKAIAFVLFASRS